MNSLSPDEILQWYNLRARNGKPVSFQGKDAGDFYLHFPNPLLVYRGEGLTTFPFLSVQPFQEEEFVEIFFEHGGQVFFSFKAKPFIIDLSTLKESLQEAFPFEQKFGFLILNWNDHTPSARTDRAYRKDYTSIEAYHKGKCLYITLVGPEGLYEISYSKQEPWGTETEESFRKLQAIIEKHIDYDHC